MSLDLVKGEERTRIYLLLCGFLASLLFFVTDTAAGLLYPGYDFSSQAISELFAIGAPTSSWVVPLFTLESVLNLAFALGVWRTADQNSSLRLVAFMIFGNAVNGLVLWNVFPMHMRGADATFTDTMHILLAGIGVVFVLGVVVIVTLSSTEWLRIFTIVIIFVILVPGAAVFLFIPGMVMGEPTPWVGLTERVSTYGYFLWQAYYIRYLIGLRKNDPIK